MELLEDLLEDLTERYTLLETSDRLADPVAGRNDPSFLRLFPRFLRLFLSFTLNQASKLKGLKVKQGAVI